MKKFISFLASTLIVFLAFTLTIGLFYIKPSVAQDRNSFWFGVEKAGINSHQPGRAWCPEGTFLVALDLDGPRNYRSHDSPIVGQAMCRRAAGSGYQRWATRGWFGVEKAGINSHQPGRPWCPPGNFLVALDLDSRGNYQAHDSPVVGQAMCASLAGKAMGRWGSCSWKGVLTAGINSHQPERAWCPEGT